MRHADYAGAAGVWEEEPFVILGGTRALLGHATVG